MYTHIHILYISVVLIGIKPNGQGGGNHARSPAPRPPRYDHWRNKDLQPDEMGRFPPQVYYIYAVPRRPRPLQLAGRRSQAGALAREGMEIGHVLEGRGRVVRVELPFW